MKLEFAPLEGLTKYTFRNIHNKYYGEAVDEYYSPFIEPSSIRTMKVRAVEDIIPEHNAGYTLIPQLLTNNSGYFIEAADVLTEYGYDTVNINIGCPSNTVVKKGRGSGFLAEPDKIDKFLYEIFASGINDRIKISIKTRIGYEDVSEFKNILKVYNKYKLDELIVHPRLGKQMYSGNVHMEEFDMAYNEGKMPISYNGDILCSEDYLKLKEKYPKLKGVMIGRGAIARPEIFEEIRRAECNLLEGIGNDRDLVERGVLCENGDSTAVEDIAKLKKYHDELLSAYENAISQRVAVLHIKEHWPFLIRRFKELPDYEDRLFRNLMKCTTMLEFKIEANKLFSLYEKNKK